MRNLILSAAVLGAALASVSAVQASGGCGRDFHRNPAGFCRPNGGPLIVGPGPVVVVGPRLGVFYPGRGYWDGHRYWHRRYRWHGDWRYR